MKRLILLLIAVTVFCVLSACNISFSSNANNEGLTDNSEANEGQKELNNSEESSDNGTDESENVEQEDEGEPVMKEAGEDEITIIYSEAAFKHLTADEVIANFKEQGIEGVTANEDGSYQVTMPKAFHEQTLESIRAEVERELSGIMNGYELKAIQELKFNDTFTELIVVVNQDLPDDGLEDWILEQFAETAFAYQMQNGVKGEEFIFDIVYVDHKTGKEFNRRSGLDNW